VTTTLITLAVLFGADPYLQPSQPTLAQRPPIYLMTPVTTALFDGDQPPTYEEAPLGRSSEALTSPAPQTFVAPPSTYDPSVIQQPLPYGYAQPFTYGTIGPQPYRLGWSSRYDVAWLPMSDVSGGRGEMEMFEANLAWQKSSGWPYGMPNWILKFTPEFNLRTWQGPGLIDLPPQVYRFAGDFELAAPGRGPWGFHAAFTPAVVSDLQSSVTSDGYNWDGRGYITFQANPQLMLVGGVFYWDRVVDLVLPYAGLVWTPNDRWEWRVLFPKSRVSVFLGNVWGAATWLYGDVSYNSEAYQIVIDNRAVQDKIEIRDWRALIGLRFDNGAVQSFIEGGWVFGREAEFKRHTDLDFDLDTGFIGRMGIRF
jgi:hypothetical protein